MADYRKAKQNWTKPSVNRLMSRDALREEVRNGTYKINTPWDQQDEDLVEDFERALKTMDATVKHPWEEGSTELRAHERDRAAAATYKFTTPFDEDEETRRKLEVQRQSARDYKYESMFEVPPLTAKQQKIIDEYKMNPPYRVSYNVVPENKKTAKKLAPGKQNPITRKPWEYGSVPADPVPFKIHERPPTALWSVPPKQESPEDALPSSGDPILDNLRAQLRKHGAAGIAGLSRKFRIMDDDGSGTLDVQEFIKGMKECKVVDLSEKALKHLFRYFDRDDSGVISYDEFLVGVRGVLNERRKQLVHLAFRILDKDGSGRVDMGEIKGVFNASSHPDVIQGRRTEEEVLTEFVLAFQVGSKDRDAVITKEEFENYYANLSASIDRDDYFELMIRNAWHISGGEGWCANTTNRRVLVTHLDGRQTVEEIQSDLGLRADDKRGMTQRLKAQGLNVASINTNGLGDMGNQYEDPDRVVFQRDQSGDNSGRSSDAGGRRAGSLADYASGGRPGTSGGAGAAPNSRGPRSLAECLSGAPAPVAAGSAYAAPPCGAGHSMGQGTGAATAAKPVSLASYVNNGAGGDPYGSGRRR